MPALALHVGTMQLRTCQETECSERYGRGCLKRLYGRLFKAAPEGACRPGSAP